MSSITGQRGDHGTAVLEKGTPLSDKLCYTHCKLPSNSQVLLPLMCHLNHIIKQKCFPFPCLAWSPPCPQLRGLFERLPQQREKSSLRIQNRSKLKVGRLLEPLALSSVACCEFGRISLSCTCLHSHQLCPYPGALSTARLGSPRSTYVLSAQLPRVLRLPSLSHTFCCPPVM